MERINKYNILPFRTIIYQFLSPIPTPNIIKFQINTAQKNYKVWRILKGRGGMRMNEKHLFSTRKYYTCQTFPFPSTKLF